MFKSKTESAPNHWSDGIKFPAKLNAPFDVADKFSTIKPMIFAHGYYAVANDHLGLYREIASHGHFVLAPDLIEGASRYTELEDGTDVILDQENPLTSVKARTEFFDDRCR